VALLIQAREIVMSDSNKFSNTEMINLTCSKYVTKVDRFQCTIYILTVI
jgi:hypothetical protein